MNIINDPYRSFSSGLGASIGSGISSGLESLANLKTEDMLQRKQLARAQQERERIAQNINSVVGDPEISTFLANLEPQERKVAFQNLDVLKQLASQKIAPQASTQAAPIQQPSFAMPNQSPTTNLAALGGQAQKVPAAQLQQAIAQQPSLNQAAVAAQKPVSLQDAFVSPAEKREREKLELQKVKINKAEEALNKKLEHAEKLQERKLGIQQELEAKKIASAEAKEAKKIELEEKKLATKENKAYIDQTFATEKAAKESDLRLGKLEKLVEKGKLPNSALWSFLDKVENIGTVGSAGAGAGIGGVIGGPVGAAIGGIAGAVIGPLAGAAKSVIRATSPDIEEFEKTSADFIKNAKQYFGSRLTDADLRAFMATIPTLMQTDAGKKRVIENLRSFNQLAEIEAKTVRKILKENKGISPQDLRLQVQDRMKDEIDRVAKLFTA